MTPEEVRELAGIAVERRVARGVEVFKKGANSSELYVIVGGRIEIDAPADDGRDLALRSLGPGDVFGEIAMFDRCPRSATARASDDAILLVLDGRDMRAHLERRPQVAIKLLELFASRLRMTTEQLEDNVFLDVETRLAKALLGMAKGGSDGGRGARTPPVTLARLAERIGTVREQVSRHFAVWEKSGAVRRVDRCIEIVDPEPLRRLVGGTDT
jgi:CRP-like cAMP-binding protein